MKKYKKKDIDNTKGKAADKTVAEIRNAYRKMVEAGYTPTAIILPNASALRNYMKDINVGDQRSKFVGMEIKEQVLVDSKGELIPIAFEVEEI